MNQKQLETKTAQLMGLREDESAIKKVLTPLKEELKSYVSLKGEEGDNSKFIEVDTTKGVVILRNIKKRTVSVKHTALEYIKAELTKRQQLKLIENIEVLREDILTQMLEDDALTPTQVENIFNVDISESFTPKYK